MCAYKRPFQLPCDTILLLPAGAVARQHLGLIMPCHSILLALCYGRLPRSKSFCHLQVVHVATECGRRHFLGVWQLLFRLVQHDGFYTIWRRRPGAFCWRTHWQRHVNFLRRAGRCCDRDTFHCGR